MLKDFANPTLVAAGNNNSIFSSNSIKLFSRVFNCFSYTKILSSLLSAVLASSVTCGIGLVFSSVDIASPRDAFS